MKPVRLHPEARAEFETAVAWLGSRSGSRSTGVAFTREVDAVMARITDSPAQFPVWQDDPRYRKATLPVTFHYAVFFRERPDHVQILAVAHGAREPGYWSRRR